MNHLLKYRCSCYVYYTVWIRSILYLLYIISYIFLLSFNVFYQEYWLYNMANQTISIKKINNEDLESKKEETMEKYINIQGNSN